MSSGVQMIATVKCDGNKGKCRMVVRMRAGVSPVIPEGWLVRLKTGRAYCPKHRTNTGHHQ